MNNAELSLIEKSVTEDKRKHAIEFAQWLKKNFEPSIRNDIWYGFEKGTSKINGEYGT